MGFTKIMYVLILVISLKIRIVRNYGANGMYDLQYNVN